MKIAVDAMGGDHAPGAVVAGAVLAASQVDGEIILVGRQPVIEAELAKLGARPSNLLIHHAEDVVEMGESPLLALRQKAGSSVTVSVDLVRDGAADAAVSAGNSGAMMAAATMRLRTLPGVQRPAIAITLPTDIGKRIVLDAGANVECKPEHLVEFGLMGSVFCEHVLGVVNPRVGLLSIGTERSKGNDLTQAAFPLLERAPLNFIGNIEGEQIVEGAVDVTVCDGFVGNVVLKVCEGVGSGFMHDLKAAIKGSVWGKLGAFFLAPALRQMGAKYDYAEYGGALLLGVNGVCIISHGKSDARAIAKAIVVAATGVKSQVQTHMAQSFEQYATKQSMAASQ
ncbi:MAG: phosphate acyltransferase PlsX [Armatimonadia bacterium]